MLTITTFWANAADNRSVVFFSFAQKLGFDISCRFSQGDNLHEMLSEPVSLKIKKNNFNCRLLKLLSSMLKTIEIVLHAL